MTGRRGTTALLLGALLVPGLSAPALAVEDPTTGYWTRTRIGAPVPVQPPDPVPEGGSWVSGDPLGPVAVTAVRAGSDDGSVVVGLRLTVADAVGAPAVLVCPTTERWAPEQGGRLEAAPEADCTTPVETAVEEDVLVVDLPPELQTDVVDLLLTPAPGSAFSITFERATAESIVQAPEDGGAPGGSAPLPTTTQTEEDFTPASGPSSGFSGGSDLSIPDFGAPATAPEPLLPPPALPEPDAAGPVPQPQAAPPAAQANVVALRPAATPVDRTASLLAVALLVGTAAWAVRLAAQPVAAPRHLGGGARLSRAEGVSPSSVPVAPADGPARGVGRFRSTRVRPPVRI